MSSCFSTRAKAGRAVLLSLLMAALLPACSTLSAPAPQAEPHASAPAADSLPAEFGTASAGTRLALASSPWGAAVSVILHPLYPAASGRMCRELTVLAGGGSQPGLACQRAGGGWEAVRVLHHAGRPVL